GERAVAVVVVKHVAAEVSDEQVGETVVVVIAHANALPPARTPQSRLVGHVSESAVAVVAVKVIGRRIASDCFQAGSVDLKNVEPPVIIEVEEGDSAADIFQLVFVLLLAAVNRLRGDAGFAGDVDEPELLLRRQAGGERNQDDKGVQKTDESAGR